MGWFNTTHMVLSYACQSSLGFTGRGKDEGKSPSFIPHSLD